MKLHQTVIKESTGPIPMEMMMQSIIDNGSAGNHAQIVMLAVLSEYFKDGPAPTLAVFDGLPTLGSKATSTELISHLEQLSPADQVKLAKKMLEFIKEGSQMISNPSMSAMAWIEYVLQRQGK